MSSLNAQQIATLLQQQGVAKEKIPTMTAIALAESRGRSQAFNPNAQTGDRSYGLFQVNMHGGLGPARMKQFGLKSEKDLFNPETNVKAAKQILEGQGLGAWSVYKGGQYKQFLPEAQKATSSLGLPQAQAPTQTQSGPTQSQPGGNTYIILGAEGKPEPADFLSGYVNQLLNPKTQVKSNIDPTAVLIEATGLNKTSNYFGDLA
jgi:hypothetical protein